MCEKCDEKRAKPIQQVFEETPGVLTRAYMNSIELSNAAAEDVAVEATQYVDLDQIIPVYRALAAKLGVDLSDENLDEQLQALRLLAAAFFNETFAVSLNVEPSAGQVFMAGLFTGMAVRNGLGDPDYVPA